MKKKVLHNVRLRVSAGTAAPVPAIASALGPKGINLMKFCNDFNAMTKDKYPTGSVLKVLIKMFSDKTHEIIIKGFSSSHLIKEAIKLKKGSSLPGKDLVAKIQIDELRGVVKNIIGSMNTLEEEQALKTLAGTAKSMGLEVVYE